MYNIFIEWDKMSLKFIKKGKNSKNIYERNVNIMSVSSFVGTHYHSLDAKNRLSIPVRFRDILGDRFLVVPGPSNKLWLYPEETFEEIAEQYRRTHRDTTQQDNFFKEVREAVVDVKGRVTLYGEHVKHAQLQKDVVITGGGRRAVVWAIENYKPTAVDDYKPDIDYSADVDW